VNPSGSVLQRRHEVRLMLYVVCATLLTIGGLGLLTTLLLGGHLGHHSGHHQAHHSAGPKHVGGRGSGWSQILNLLSPLVFFSICLGAGASGMLAIHLHAPKLLTIASAAAGGLAFYGLVIRPLISVVLNFASTPSKALEGSVSEPAEVISHFDSSGRGLVKLTVDGQIVRVLATLEESDRPLASEIQPGDKLVVTTIDSHTNACRVARL
jgi:hypothetical protein